MTILKYIYIISLFRVEPFIVKKGLNCINLKLHLSVEFVFEWETKILPHISLILTHLINYTFQ